MSFLTVAALAIGVTCCAGVAYCAVKLSNSDSAIDAFLGAAMMSLPLALIVMKCWGVLA